MIWFVFLLPPWSSSGKAIYKLWPGKSGWLLSGYSLLRVGVASTMVKLSLSLACLQYTALSFLLQLFLCWFFFLSLFLKLFHFRWLWLILLFPQHLFQLLVELVQLLVSTTPATLSTVLMSPKYTSLVMSLTLISAFQPFFLFFNVYFWKRECEWERGREGDTESEAGSRLQAVSTEPDTGFEPINCEIMTWAEVGHLANWASQAPLVCIFL